MGSLPLDPAASLSPLIDVRDLMYQSPRAYSSSGCQYGSDWGGACKVTVFGLDPSRGTPLE